MRRELEHFGKFVAMGIFVSFAALPLFALVVAVMPHCITEWPYVVFIVAFALLFAKSSIRRAFIADGLEAKEYFQASGCFEKELGFAERAAKVRALWS